MLRCTASVFTHHTESVCVVDHDAELVFLLESCDLVEDSKSTCHAVHAFCDEEDSTTLLFSFLTCPCNDSLTILDVVMTIFILASYVESDTVKQTCMRLSIIHYHIVTAYERIDSRYDTLISEIELEGSFLLLESCKTAFKFLMEMGLSCHHSASHRVCKPPPGSCFSICLTDFRMICKTEVVVEAPAEYVLTVESHVRAKFAFKARKCEISFRLLFILTDRSTGRFSYSVKNVCKHNG